MKKMVLVFVIVSMTLATSVYADADGWNTLENSDHTLASISNVHGINGTLVISHDKGTNNELGFFIDSGNDLAPVGGQYYFEIKSDGSLWAADMNKNWSQIGTLGGPVLPSNFDSNSWNTLENSDHILASISNPYGGGGTLVISYDKATNDEFGFFINGGNNSNNLVPVRGQYYFEIKSDGSLWGADMNNNWNQMRTLGGPVLPSNFDSCSPDQLNIVPKIAGSLTNLTYKVTSTCAAPMNGLVCFSGGNESLCSANILDTPAINSISITNLTSTFAVDFVLPAGVQQMNFLYCSFGTLSLTIPHTCSDGSTPYTKTVTPTPPSSEVLTGSGTWTGTNSVSAQFLCTDYLGGMVPNPVVDTLTFTADSISVTVNGHLETPGTYSAVVNEGSGTMTIVEPGFTCLTGTGSSQSYPGSSSTNPFPGATSSITITSNGSTLTFNNFSDLMGGLPVSACAYSGEGSVMVQAVTGIVGVIGTLNITCLDPVSGDTAKMNYLFSANGN